MPTFSLELAALRPDAVTLSFERKAPAVAKPAMPKPMVLLESLVACGLAMAVALVLSPGDAGLGRPGPYLAWIAVLLVAARYGTKGLFLSLPLSAAMMVVAAAALGKMRVLG